MVCTRERVCQRQPTCTTQSKTHSVTFFPPRPSRRCARLGRACFLLHASTTALPNFLCSLSDPRQLPAWAFLCSSCRGRFAELVGATTAPAMGGLIGAKEWRKITGIKTIASISGENQNNPSAPEMGGLIDAKEWRNHRNKNHSKYQWRESKQSLCARL